VTAWFRGRARTVAPAVGCFGKLPLDREFLRVNAHHPEVEGLDRWIQGGLAAAHERSAGDPAGEGRGLYGDWTGSHFLLPPAAAGQRYCLGHMAPSQDSAGRRYPCVAFLLAPPREAEPIYLAPLRFLPFFDAAAAVVGSGMAAADRSAWLDEVRGLTGVAAPGVAPAAPEEAVGVRLGRLLPDGDADAVAGVLQLLVETVVGRPRGGWVLRLPLTREPLSRGVADWLHLLDQLRPRGAAEQVALWGPVAADGAALWVIGGQPTPRAFLFLVDGGGDDRLVDATDPDTVAQATSRVGDGVVEALAGDGIAVSRLSLCNWRA